MQKELITTDAQQTQEMGRMLAAELRGGETICLSGELGAGKTTFTQGLLGGLGLEGPFTSPTFLIMKEYIREISKSKCQISNKISGYARSGEARKIPKSKIQKVYHIDAYRIGTEDILALGWKEMVVNPNNVIIIEWAERVKDVIPKDALWIDFEWIGEEERKIILKSE